MAHNNNNQIRGNWFSSIAEKSDFNMTITKDSNEPQKLKWEIGDILTNTVTGERWIAYELTDMWWTDIVTGEKYEYPTLKLFNGTTGESQNWRVDRLTRAYFYNETNGDGPPHNLDQLLKEEATNDLEDYYKSKATKKKKGKVEGPHHTNVDNMMTTEEYQKLIEQQDSNWMPTTEYQEMYDSLEKELDRELKKETAKVVAEHYDNNMRIATNNRGSRRRKQS